MLFKLTAYKLFKLKYLFLGNTQWLVNWGVFLTSPIGLLQNGGSSGAAALQQEMNSDIRAMDLGAPTASWEIMALGRETTHVISEKRNPFTVLEKNAQVYPDIIHGGFSLKFQVSKVIHHW